MRGIVRMTQKGWTVMVVIVAGASIGGCKGDRPTDEITVKRINVVDESGEVRLVIAGDVPDPVVRGQEYPRSIAPAGLIWHDEDGSESGGIATVSTPDGGEMRAIIFDFAHQPTDAISLGTMESADGERWRAGLTVYDMLPYQPGPIETTQGTRRIMLGSANQDAGLVILDADERERIRIGVDPDGLAVLEILNADGEVLSRAPD